MDAAFLEWFLWPLTEKKNIYKKLQVQSMWIYLFYNLSTDKEARLEHVSPYIPSSWSKE